MRQQVEIESTLKQKTAHEWIAILEDAGVPTGEITFPEDLLQSPQLIENNYLGEIDHPSGTQKHVMPHVQFSKFPTITLDPSPSLGRDTERVVSQLT
ncbi:MAG TPA: hypothetical protein EYG53_13330 [Gammaproteobacteria bacterium]|jgi:crotonobetainyl-CoA:carnitine CoA-transferase CaiB-like acyl-CoA transferase|nr:hypothetical protein [Gammaproteobacteria bacterium]